VTLVVDFLKRAAERNGFRRDRFEEKLIPTEFSNVCILPFFGDLRNTVVLSTFILQRFRESLRGSKYFIVASWPGMQGLFPYADEYWSLTDEAVIKKFYEYSEGMRNKSDLNLSYIRNLNEFFRDVIEINEMQKFYKNGFTSLFFDKFQNTKKYLPFIPSASIIGKDFNKELATRSGYKVFIHPSLFCKFWHNGISENIKSNKYFWIELVKYLVDKKITPVIWQNFLSHDISSDVGESAIVLKEPDFVRAMAAMRACSCVIDIFNGLSRLAILSRCPFLSVDERSRYTYTKEKEIDDLAANNIPYEYIFSFSTIVMNGDITIWSNDVFQSIVNKLEKFLPELNRESWPSTIEVNESVPYRDFVHVHKKKRLGTRFIKVTHD
jgi:hypothetical protein